MYYFFPRPFCYAPSALVRADGRDTFEELANLVLVVKKLFVKENLPLTGCFQQFPIDGVASESFSVPKVLVRVHASNQTIWPSRLVKGPTSSPASRVQLRDKL